MDSSSSAPPRKINYDVFLSFRGTDTRKTFVDHLYNQLVQKGIHTFKDDEGLEKGHHISKLLQLIEESRFAIVVFSKDYASSKWCLEEIATIMECQEQYGEQIVITIFYDVEPTDVRNQTGSFAESFAEHEKSFKDDKAKVERWKEALRKACSLSGYHLKNDYNGFEAECVQTVVDDMFTRLNQCILASTVLEKSLLGLDSRVDYIGKLLRMEPNDVRFIGIWGMGGIGKTTIARIVLKRFSSQFDGVCFLADIRENQGNISELQKTLIKKILKGSADDISNVHDGMEMIMTWLKEKKVLIVLDDVDHVEQLRKLAGERDWFGGGSRVIITTRDAGVLRSHGVDKKYIYEVDTLGEEEGIQLFRSYAFKKKPKTGVEELCGSIVHYCKGLPLALKVLGSSLCGLEAAEWESTLEELKDTPIDDIDAKLKISFDRLDSKNKKIFLHIACFFTHKTEEYVKDVLKSCDLQADIAMRNLTEKSLISVQDGEIEMHDLIQEMGWHIAREEKPRSRVWQLKDVDDVLSGEMVPKHIEAISWGVSSLSWWRIIDCRTFEITFRGMRNLKMLEVGVGNNVLRVMDNYLPSSLRCLSLQNNSLENCRITQKLDKLTILDLSFSESLLETPDFDLMPNLMRLYLRYCNNLKVVHPSIGNLRKLVLLDLSSCSNLENIPSFNQVSSLKSLCLGYCKELKYFPEIKARTPHLVKLVLREVGIIELPSSIQQLHGLTKLCLDYCEHLEYLCDSLCKLKNLKVLEIKHCRKLKSLPENLEGLISLEYLCLLRSCFDSLPKLPANIKELYTDCGFKIAELAIQCSKLYLVSFSTGDQHGVIASLAKQFIRFPLHRKTPLCVSYVITNNDVDVDFIDEKNNMLRTFKYRQYKSNGISINLNSSWYSQNFVGFAICFFEDGSNIWEPHSYQDIGDSIDNCMIIVRLSHKDNKNEILQTNCVVGRSMSWEFVTDYTTICFAYIPVRSLWHKSKAIMDYSRFEGQFMNLKASADWGCSLLYERQTGARGHMANHSGSDLELTTDDIGCFSSLGLEMEYLNLNRRGFARLSKCYSQLPHLRYLDISSCGRPLMLPKLPATIRELHAHSNLASESNITKLASKYSELYSVSFSNGYVTLSAEELARKFVDHVPFQIRDSAFVVTYPAYDDLTDIDTLRWFKYPSKCSNKVSINLKSSWYSHTFVGFVVCFLLSGREHRWESHPNIRPVRHCKVIAKLIPKDNAANEVRQINCVIGRLYDEEFCFNKDDFMICFAYIPFCSVPSVNPNEYSVFELAFSESSNSSDWSCGLLYKNDESLSEAIRSNASYHSNDNDLGLDITKSWQLTEIVHPCQCQMVSMPECFDAKVVGLLYTKSGVGILALSSNGIYKLWKWFHLEQNPSRKATANLVPQHWQKNSGLVINYVSGVNLEELVPCIALSNNIDLVASATGRKVSLFYMETFKEKTTFMWRSTLTFIAFHPRNNDIIAIGTEDSTIYIYNVIVKKVMIKLKGHHKHITGLTFSANNPNMLVSSGADAQLCVWNIIGRWKCKKRRSVHTGRWRQISSFGRWKCKKRRSVRIQLSAGEVPSGDTQVMFHSDQLHLLVTHETQLAIYDASMMDQILQWIPHGSLSAPISSATYSCNSQLVYASFKDGNIGVLDANSLRLRCRIAPSAYLSLAVSDRSLSVYPVMIAAHSREPNQFAVGLTNGSIKVIKPRKSERMWGVSPHTNYEHSDDEDAPMTEHIEEEASMTEDSDEETPRTEDNDEETPVIKVSSEEAPMTIIIGEKILSDHYHCETIESQQELEHSDDADAPMTEHIEEEASMIEDSDEETSRTKDNNEETPMIKVSSEEAPMAIIIGEEIQSDHYHCETIESQQELGKDRTKPWQLTEIVDPIQCRMVSMPDCFDAKVSQLLYTKSGVGILALSVDGTHKLWKWSQNIKKGSTKVTANSIPQYWQTSRGLFMINESSGVDLEEVVPCMALYTDSWVALAVGGKVSLSDVETFVVFIMWLPSASTFLACHPHCNIIAIGLKDSTIHIYSFAFKEVKLTGHRKPITGLAFSTKLNILVSSSSDAQLCVWSIDTWEMRSSFPIHLPAGKLLARDTQVMFHADQIHLLVTHESQLAVYDASKIELISQWIPHGSLSAPISSATYSCDSQLVYASFKDGNIGVFNADSLTLRCHIAPSAYISQAVLSRSEGVYPLVIAAHPREPNQFVVGLTDGSVKVIEPLESEGKWGVSPPVDNGMLNGLDKTKPWQLTEIVHKAQCRVVSLPQCSDAKVVRLLYTNSGVDILALSSNGIQNVWKWSHNEQNPSGKATANSVPQHWQPNSGLPMINDVSGVNLEEVAPCMALSNNDSYVVLAGRNVSLFDINTCWVLTTLMFPSASTFLAFHPHDNDIIAIGTEDSTIYIYNSKCGNKEVKVKLRGHQKRITGLAFSTNLNMLVSSSVNAQLCAWSIDTWEKRISVPIELPSGDTRVMFHVDQVHLLVTHETQLAIYDASKMECINQWMSHGLLSAPISSATYSCNSQLVYASFKDGNIGVLDANSLRLRCRIAPSAYLSQPVLNRSESVYVVAIATHPQQPNQLAIGLTDGSVKVIEPLEYEGEWGISPLVDIGIPNEGEEETFGHHLEQRKKPRLQLSNFL